MFYLKKKGITYWLSLREGRKENRKIPSNLCILFIISSTQHKLPEQVHSVGALCWLLIQPRLYRPVIRASCPKVLLSVSQTQKGSSMLCRRGLCYGLGQESLAKDSCTHG